MTYTQWYDNPKSPVGRLLLFSDGELLTQVSFDGHQRGFDYSVQENAPVGSTSLFDETREWLDTYFDVRDPGPLPKYRLYTTEFRKEVCEIMARIPYGTTVTYGDICAEIAGRRGKRMSAQAVGGAVGHNPIGIIIPCHRVVGAGGNLTGYGGGMDRKVSLLELEGFDMSQFRIPTKGTALHFD